jgi:AraC family transcriptional regulator, transcriptional activator of pobA
MKRNFPIYAIRDFQEISGEGSLYASFIKEHVAQHHFTNLPHKHDFYLTILFTGGKGTHEVDFETYEVKPGTLFILKPGQMHHWTLSKDIDGFVFFHTKEFYDEGFTMERLENYSFLKSFQSHSYFKLNKNTTGVLKELMHRITVEYRANEYLKFQKIHALINLCYIEIARLNRPEDTTKDELYLKRLRLFEELLDQKYKTIKSAAIYASELNITEKHLNRIIRGCLNKTTTQLIAERIILEAKRMLVQAKYNVEEIGTELGYADKSYFSRFFKKNAGVTPREFLDRYKKGCRSR